MPRRPSIAKLQSSIDRLSPEEQQRLYDWLGRRLREQSTEIDLPPSTNAMRGASIETHNHKGKTYVPQKRRCGKLGCSCMDGEISEVGHGPYWYAYWNEDGKTQNQYVGKRLPWQKEQKENKVFKSVPTPS